MGDIRFPVAPRDISSVKAARRLSLTEHEFESVKERLFARGFPRPDPDTHNYDLKAIDAWMDKRSGLTETSLAADASIGFHERLGRMRAAGRKKG